MILDKKLGNGYYLFINCLSCIHFDQIDVFIFVLIFWNFIPSYRSETGFTMFADIEPSFYSAEVKFTSFGWLRFLLFHSSRFELFRSEKLYRLVKYSGNRNLENGKILKIVQSRR